MDTSRDRRELRPVVYCWVHLQLRDPAETLLVVDKVQLYVAVIRLMLPRRIFSR